MNLKSIRSLLIAGLLIIGNCLLAFAAEPEDARGGSPRLSAAELADSLDAYTNARMLPMARVRVYRIRERGTRIDVETNVTMSGLSLTRDELGALKRQVSLWIRGDEKGQVYIYSDTHELGELVRANGEQRVANGERNLEGKRIALWPSHGAFLRKDSVWHWQRARMWGIVEDIYTTHYAELVTQMLENAGAEVLWPRPRLGVDSAATEIGESGLPRWMEAARYWLQYRHYPEWIWNTWRFQPKAEEPDHYKDDLRCHGNWVNYLNDSICKLDMALALHTDGLDMPGDSTLMGTLCLYTDWNDKKETVLCDGRSRMQCRYLGDYIQTQITEDMRQTICPEWPRRELRQANYCETRVPDIPVVIMEILSHKSRADMEYGLNPEAQMILARAIYKGVLRYLTDGEGVIQPLPVHAMRVEQDEESWCLKWEAQEDPLEPTAVAERYIVQYRKDEGDWRDTTVYEEALELPIKAGVQYDFRVEAVNIGGKSLPSEIVSAYRPNDSAYAQLMIVNGFREVRGPRWFIDSTFAGIVPGSYAVADGIDHVYLGEQMEFRKSAQWVDDDNCGYGMCYSDYLGKAVVGNTHDYPVLHGRVLSKAGIGYVSCSSDCEPDSVRLDQYALVDYVAGRDTMTANGEWRKAIERYVKRGGRLLASGAFIGDKNIQAARNACTNGQVRTEDMQMYAFQLRPNEARMCAENATAFKPYNGGRITARYTDTNLGACFEWNGRVIVWGIPLESMDAFPEIYRKAIEKLIGDK